jgi:hypothetical protein
MARVGVPSFSVGEGTLFAGHDAAWGLAKEDDYTAHRYHNFSDNYTPDMDFSGDAKMARFGMELGWEALSAPTMVEWKRGDEFEAARRASLSTSPARCRTKTESDGWGSWLRSSEGSCAKKTSHGLDQSCRPL